MSQYIPYYLEKGSNYVIQLEGVQNPPVSGVTGTIDFELLKYGTYVVLEEYRDIPGVTISPGTIS